VPFRRRNRGLACPILLVILCTPAAAQQVPDIDNFGGTGLLDMPSAAMLPDGHLVLNATYQLDTQHYNLTFQALPWLETSFRYSGLTHFSASYPVYWDRAFAVKVRLLEEDDFIPSLAIGINDLVGTGIYSGEYIVATKNIGSVEATLGMGWGRLGTAGSFRNPLSLISKSFDTRATGFSGLGGEFSFGKYFHGPAALFGGLAWHTPIENLTLKAEYSSDDYDNEAHAGGFSPRNQFNFGAAYRAYDNIVFGLSWMYGRSLSGSISFDLDPSTTPFSQRLEPTPVPLNFRSASDQAMALQVLKGHGNQPLRSAAATSSDDLWRILPDLQNVALTGTTLELTLGAASQATCIRVAGQIDALALNITSVTIRNNAGTQVFHCAARSPLQFAQMTVYQPNSPSAAPAGLLAEPMMINAAGTTRESQAKAAAKLRADAATQNLRIETVTMQQGTLTIYYMNTRYQVEAEAVDKLLRVAMADAPPEIERFRFIAYQNGLQLAEYDILRATAERSFQQEGQYDLLANNSGPLPAPMSATGIPRSTFPRFTWGIFPQLRQEFFDPSNPLGIQLVAGAYASVELFPGFSLSGEVETSLFSTFGTDRISDSVLPHVRTDFLEYIVHGKNGIGALSGEYKFRLAPTVYAIARAGYLESMFAGVGGEVLWRPEGQRWALGADLYEVKQRAFDRLFGFLPYKQTTGHITLYYDSPWYDLNFQLRAGQYLAGDRGATFQVSRRFSTGVEIGVFATKTNVSAQQFGEGSFDKGIFIHIPLDWVLPAHSQISLDEMIRPVQRDGGQTLAGDATLFDMTRGTSEADAHLIKWN
jgi:hypothetical protein